MNDQLTKANGEICFQSSIFPGEKTRPAYDGLSAYFERLETLFAVKGVPSETPDTKLWTLTREVSSYKLGEERLDTLGMPSDYSRWFSLVRIWTPWLAPRHGKGDFSITEDAVLCSFLRWDGLQLVLLALSGIDETTSVFKSNQHSGIDILSRSDGKSKGRVTIIAAVGKTFESAIAAAMYLARKIVGGTADMDVERAKKDIQPEWLENWYDGLTYCTWNGLGQDLTEQKISNALVTLEKNEISGKYLTFNFMKRCLSSS